MFEAAGPLALPPPAHVTLNVVLMKIGLITVFEIILIKMRTTSMEL